MQAPDLDLTAFFEDLTRFPEVQLTPKQRRTIEWNRAGWFADWLTRKSFRRGSVHPSTLLDIRTKLRKCLDDSEPIYLIICFGGYKHFWNPSFPEVDFAELFNFRFMMDVVAPLVSLHKPGVILDYESDDAVVSLIDNYPRTSLEAYAASFRRLLDWYRRVANPPDNLRISLVRPQEDEEYRKLDYEKALARRIYELRPTKALEWQHLDNAERQVRLHRTAKSIMWVGEKDLSGLSDAEKGRMLLQSKMDNEIYYEADAEFREHYFTGGTHIPIVQSWGLCYENSEHWLTLASTYASTVDFWIGRGVLEIAKSGPVARIVSQSQYDSLRSSLQKVDRLPWPSSGPQDLKNFRSMDVIRRMPP